MGDFIKNIRAGWIIFNFESKNVTRQEVEIGLLRFLVIFRQFSRSILKLKSPGQSIIGPKVSHKSYVNRNILVVHRALTADLVMPLPSLKELRVDGNDISMVAKNAFIGANDLETLSLRDNPLSCDCSLKPFAEWMLKSSISAQV